MEELLHTWLPYPNFANSAACLDDGTLERQRVSCQRIMACLDDGGHGLPEEWRGHKVVAMWRGYRSALGVYMTICCTEWERRGYSQTMMTPYSPLSWLRQPGYPGELAHSAYCAKVPWWLGRRELHESHQRTLLYLNPEHYRGNGWRVVPELKVWWPEISNVEEDAL